MNTYGFRRLAVAIALLTPVLLAGRQGPPPSPGGDMIDRIFRTREFSTRPVPRAQWMDGGASYVLVEPVPDRAGEVSVVKYDSATGARREVLITAAQLTAQGAGAPLQVDELSWSADGQRVLVFTNTRRVWRT